MSNIHRLDNNNNINSIIKSMVQYMPTNVSII